MLITPASHQLRKHVELRESLTDHFNVLMEKLLMNNKHKDKYWVLGKVTIQKIRGKELVKPFLQACDEKPGLVRESFVYEVDNTRGVKTLLWVMHPGDMLSFPTLGKSIRVTGANRATILMPQ